MSDETGFPRFFVWSFVIQLAKSVWGICGMVIYMKHTPLQIIFSSLFFVLFGIDAFAQSDIVPTGGTATGNGGTVTYTIGQIAVKSYGDGGTSISEGVQQPYEIQTIGIDNYPSITLNAMVYPNPTTSNLQLAISNEEFEGEVKVFDTNGKYLYSKKIEGKKTEIPMSDLATGTYFVNVLNGTQILKSFKVVKMAR